MWRITLSAVSTRNMASRATAIWSNRCTQRSSRPARGSSNLRPAVSTDSAVCSWFAGVRNNQSRRLVADNSPRWLIADQGIITAGAVNVCVAPRQNGKNCCLLSWQHSAGGGRPQDLKTARSPRLSTPCRFIWWSCSRMKSQRQTKP